MKLGTQFGRGTIVEGQAHNIFYRTELANPNLRPERTRETEYGADATLFGNVVAGLTWNRRRTDAQLFQLANPGGLYASWANIGNMEGHGFEATLTIPVLDMPTVRADVAVAYMSRTDRVLSLQNIPESRTTTGGGFAVGYPVGSVFGQRVISVTDTADGGPDSVANYSEITRDTVNRFLGVVYPPKTVTVTPTLAVLGGHVRISTLFDRQTGFLRYDAVGARCRSSAFCVGPFVRSTSLIDQARYLGQQRDDFLVPGDFTRWREFNVAVDVPERFVRLDVIHLRFTSATVSVQGRNLMLWSAYKGTDPETRLITGSDGAISNGIPQARGWALRFDVTP